MPRPWSEEELEVLEALSERRVPYDRIANALPGRSPEAIRQMLIKRGLWKRYAPKPDVAAYKELLRIYKG